MRSALLALALLAAPRAAAAAEASRPALAIALLEPRGLARVERPGAVESLLSAVARRTSVDASPEPPPRLGPRDPRLFDYPLVLLSGAAPFAPFDDRELDAMRAYLSLGGMVIVDDASGEADSAFARLAKAELSRALGGRPFVPLPEDHAAYRSFYLLDRAWGRLEVGRDLSAIVLGGRAAAIFSPNDLMGAWARDELGHPALDVKPGGTAQREMAVRTGVNLVLYSLCLDYKQDLVHLPLILERRR